MRKNDTTKSPALSRVSRLCAVVLRLTPNFCLESSRFARLVDLNEFNTYNHEMIRVVSIIQIDLLHNLCCVSDEYLDHEKHLNSLRKSSFHSGSLLVFHIVFKSNAMITNVFCVRSITHSLLPLSSLRKWHQYIVKQKGNIHGIANPIDVNNPKGESYMREREKEEKSNEENERNNPSATRREWHIDIWKRENDRGSEARDVYHYLTFWLIWSGGVFSLYDLIVYLNKVQGKNIKTT